MAEMTQQLSRLLAHLVRDKLIGRLDQKDIQAAIRDAPEGADARQILADHRSLHAAQLVHAQLALHGSDDWMVPGYTLETQIGRGAMGTVYQAVRQSDGERVALKLVSERYLSDPTSLVRFQRELDLASRLDHQGLPWYGEMGQCRSGNHFYTMQLVSGEDLRTRTKRLGGPISEEVGWKILYQMTLVLKHLDQHGIVHRDIKPGNILIDDEIIWLCDLGLAIAPGEDTLKLTDHDQVMGTPYYMSPEQVRGERKLSIKSDVYSLGATMYQAVAGRVPFEGNSAMEVMRQHDVSEVEPPREVRPELSPEFDELILIMMGKELRDRPTPDQLAELVNRALKKLHDPADAPAGSSTESKLLLMRPGKDPGSRGGRGRPGTSRRTPVSPGPSLWLSVGGLAIGLGLLAFLLVSGC